MKKIYSILFLLIAVSLGFSSCSDDDVVKTQLEAPAISHRISRRPPRCLLTGSLWLVLPSMHTNCMMPMKTGCWEI